MKLGAHDYTSTMNQPCIQIQTIKGKYSLPYQCPVYKSSRRFSPIVGRFMAELRAVDVAPDVSVRPSVESPAVDAVSRILLRNCLPKSVLASGSTTRSFSARRRSISATSCVKERKRTSACASVESSSIVILSSLQYLRISSN